MKKFKDFLEKNCQWLAIGAGAEQWLTRAAAAGTSRLRRKLEGAVDLAKLHGSAVVNDALEACARAERFADGDLASVLAHQQQRGQDGQGDQGGEVIAFPERSESASLQRSTRAWEGFGR